MAKDANEENNIIYVFGPTNNNNKDVWTLGAIEYDKAGHMTYSVQESRSLGLTDRGEGHLALAFDYGRVGGVIDGGNEDVTPSSSNIIIDGGIEEENNNGN